MKIAKLGGVDIAYLDEGQGETVVLVHGFASKAYTNWVATGWVTTLVDAGYRVIALDNRGHGESSKFYSEGDYSLQEMASDVIAVLDYLDVGSFHVMGYSMGARISSMIADNWPQRAKKIILAGNGYNMIDGTSGAKAISDALLAENVGQILDKLAREFREFADQTGADNKALAVCFMAVRHPVPLSLFESITQETLITIGSEDDMVYGGEKLASLMPNARFVPIPKRNHMNAVGDKVYKQEVLKFLTE